MKVRDFVSAESESCISTGDATAPRVFLDDDERTPAHIQVMIPYWLYRRVAWALQAMDATTKPEDYIVAVLEGHVKRLNS